MSSVLARFSFLPWMRQGIGSFISQQDDLGQGSYGSYAGPDRATVPVKVTLNKGESNEYDFTKDVAIVGPGDILGIDPRNVVRVQPEPHTPNFMPNYLPFIEFFQDTFCWDYTPADHNGSQDKRLRPWLFLVVLKEGEFAFHENPEGPLSYFKLEVPQSQVFPPEDQTWAWAHVHVNVDLSIDVGGSSVNDVPAGMTKLATELEANPEFAVARIICPRKLDANSRYEAFVIPAFEVGRLAGLGLADADISGIHPQKPSWSVSNGHAGSPPAKRPDEFPIYHTWAFQTGPRGDFEYLVRKMFGKKLDPAIGFRPLDVQQESPYGIPGISNPPTLDFGGALRQQDDPVETWLDPDKASWQKTLAELLNANEHIKYVDGNFVTTPTNPLTGNPVTADPVVTPPLYGRFHSITRTVEPELTGSPPADPANFWVRELNLDPRNRAAAGLGTRIVQENQDKYMRIAWRQLGGVKRVNLVLKNAQFGVEVSDRLVKRHLNRTKASEYLDVAAPVMIRIPCNGETVQSIVANSPLPVGLLDQAGRKFRRPKGRLIRKFQAGSPALNDDILTRAADKQIQPAPDKVVGSRKFLGKDAIPDNLLKASTFLPNQQNPVPWVLSEPSNTPQEIPYFPPQEFYESTQFNELLLNIFSVTDQVYQQPPATQSFSISSVTPCIDTSLEVRETIKKRVFSRLDGIGAPGAGVGIGLCMGTPDIPEPMYKKLMAISPEYLLPNVELLPEDSITMLISNQAFIESFMVGLNVEMARELMWHEFPADQRGTFFRSFWDTKGFLDTSGMPAETLAEDLKDIDYIHKWGPQSHLGEHNNRSSDPASPNVVLAVRGELLTRFPGTEIYALKADFDGNSNRIIKDPEEIQRARFTAKMPPDISLFGFDLSEVDAKGNDTDNAGWFFVIKESPSGPRFGLDVAPDSGGPGTIASWNDVNWGHMGSANYVDVSASLTSYYDGGSVPDTGDDENPNLNWGRNSADMAYICYQVPFMMVVHAREMLFDDNA